MNKLEQAARQALEALENLPALSWIPEKERDVFSAITALRDALAEQSECKECGAKQAQIDRLMLEYCPDEMTPEQMQEWGNNQRPAEQTEQEPVAFVSDVYQSRYTLEWNGHSLPVGTPLYDHSTSQELEHMAEEAECVKLSLDKAGVPTADASGKVYSLWGRVCRYAEQAEQEPVIGAYEVVNEKGDEWSLVYPAAVHRYKSIPEERITQTFYATPVRTKDLTDDEIERALDAAKVPELPDGYKSVDLEIARAVIAADRSKNGII